MTKNHGMRRFIPSLSALTAFEAAATYRNFTRAAEDLSLTQSGVSRQVANLERQLGLRLFERSGPQLVLTNTGRAYLHEITPHLNALEEASINMVRGGSLDDALRIGVQDSLGSQWLVRRLPGFVDRVPDVEFTVVPVGGEAPPWTDGIDIAVLRGRGVWPGAHAHRLFAETITVVASPDLIPPGAGVAPEEYKCFPLIQNAHRPDSWLRWLDSMGLERKDTITGPRFAQTSMVIAAACAGLGLAIVPLIMVEEKLASGQLHEPFGHPLPSGLSYFVVYPLEQGISKPVLDLRDWLLNETRGLRRQETTAPG